MSEREIAHVILWSNGMVMVFDDHGDQMAEYQGPYAEVRDRICAVYYGRWDYGDWRKGILGMFDPREGTPHDPGA